MPPYKKLYASGEDYLETILVLQKKKGMVRSVDVARYMDVSKPSVCQDVYKRQPPERVEPPSPMIVSYPFGRDRMKSWQQARFAASITCSWVASGRPNRMLFSTES